MLLVANQIEKTYTIKGQLPNKVLKSVDFSIENGDFISVMGSSGAGKSTLLHILGGLDTSDKGDVKLFTDKEYNYSKLASNVLASIRNKYIGFVFQFHHLLPEFTALENIIMPALIGGVSKKDAVKKAQELMLLTGISKLYDNKPSQLSGGEQQRVAIARALINDPVIVFADEPTGNLDTQNSLAVIELIENINKNKNVAFVIATHSNDIASASKKTLYMKDGILQI